MRERVDNLGRLVAKFDARLDRLEARLWTMSRALNVMTGLIGAGIVGALIKMFLPQGG